MRNYFVGFTHHVIDITLCNHSIKFRYIGNIARVPNGGNIACVLVSTIMCRYLRFWTWGFFTFPVWWNLIG